MSTQSITQDSNAVQPSGHASKTADEIMGMIKGWMKERNLGEPTDPNATFADSGFDSLDSVELTFFLQDQLRVEIDETVLYNHPTFAALISYVRERL
ncbi:acyl carrier protein [Paraburkholderia flava]|uniref:acyl carrier protein n=1 Tax=Paraburkholderia flava TaxID=2547393 RepID=UPI001414FD73|nr:acyl carrier protein [Paraburkholderia flava]